MKLSVLKISALGALAALVAGCAAGTVSDPVSVPAQLIAETKTSASVRTLPAPTRKIDVAVYDLPDLTGQHKPNDEFAEFSRAVTQGADSILVDVLTRAGDGEWFNVIERRGLQNLLRERQIIQATRQQYQGGNAAALTPLLFAGVLIEGGIIAYETNLLTGGVGARYLGIGGNTQYQHDVVTVNLRLVSVQTGKVVQSVTTTKQIYSTLVQGSVFKFVALDSLLEIEAGFTRNSPPQLAVREAIELGVYSLVMEGARRGLWDFQDQAEGAESLSKYLARTGQGPAESATAKQASNAPEASVRQIAEAPAEERNTPATIADAGSGVDQKALISKKYARNQVDDTKQVRTAQLTKKTSVVAEPARGAEAPAQAVQVAKLAPEEPTAPETTVADRPQPDRSFTWASEEAEPAPEGSAPAANAVAQAGADQMDAPKTMPTEASESDRKFKWAASDETPSEPDRKPESIVVAEADRATQTQPELKPAATPKRDRKFKWVSEAEFPKPKARPQAEDLAQAKLEADVAPSTTTDLVAETPDRKFKWADPIETTSAPLVEPEEPTVAETVEKPDTGNETEVASGTSTAVPTDEAFAHSQQTPEVAPDSGKETAGLKIRLQPGMAERMAALALAPSNR